MGPIKTNISDRHGSGLSYRIARDKFIMRKRIVQWLWRIFAFDPCFEYRSLIVYFLFRCFHEFRIQQRNEHLPSPEQFEALRAAAPGDVPLAISLQWSDQALGWVARFRMMNEKGVQDWSATGVNFDEAFRVALRGAAQILSGHGAP